MRSDHDILTSEELIELTGHQYKSRQCAWLDEAGIWFKQRRDGSPSTTWYHVAHPLAYRLAPPAQAAEEPNFNAM